MYRSPKNCPICGNRFDERDSVEAMSRHMQTHVIARPASTDQTKNPEKTVEVFETYWGPVEAIN